MWYMFLMLQNRRRGGNESRVWMRYQSGCKWSLLFMECRSFFFARDSVNFVKLAFPVALRSQWLPVGICSSTKIAKGARKILDFLLAMEEVCSNINSKLGNLRRSCSTLFPKNLSAKPIWWVNHSNSIKIQYQTK